MRTCIFSTLVAGTFLLTVCTSVLAFDDDEGENPQLNLKTTLPYAKLLLEEKKYTTFLKEFAPPKLLARLLQKQSLDELATGFSRKKAGELLVLLKTIEENETQPEMSDSDSKATYAYQLEGDSKTRFVSFLKINKKWYISNKKK